MPYQPIENYGIIGNMRTAALVGRDGSMDWFCYPRFDSPSLFASILDDKNGGAFKIAPVYERVTRKQLYWPETNILVTRFLAADGVGELHDFMPVGISSNEDNVPCLIRQIHVVRGSMTFQVRCQPAFNYARDRHTVEILPSGAVFQSPGLSFQLASSIPLKISDDGVTARCTLQAGESAVLAIRMLGDDNRPREIDNAQAERLFEATIDYWQRWIAKCTYKGRWREMVYRSALVLKLLTYEPTGAIVASPTCSLPELEGGTRNWDYRYTWIRDAAFTLYGLLRIGFTEEADQFVEWLEARCHEPGKEQPLQVMYGIDGRHALTEESLGHLEGYRGSKPVRIGNGAYDQLQLDIYGELMDSLYIYNKHATPISYDLWTHLRRLVNWVCDNWHRKDEGIWEVRNGRQHFLYSKLMCWVAIDRGLRLAEKRSFPCDRNRWLKERDKVYEQIMEFGWSAERQAFVQYYGSEHLDAANLIMPLVFFVSPTDPRMLKTLEAIRRPPEQDGLVSDSLVHRYDPTKTPDGLDGHEGTFNMCTFWLVEALTRAGALKPKLLRDARLMFEQMLTYANHLGLYAEETGHSGEALGNFPQAFTHLSLISAAVNLDRALGSNGR
jgi:GH15 family glucan-1,4-alpha-glucosidase